MKNKYFFITMHVVFAQSYFLPFVAILCFACIDEKVEI